MVSAEACQEVFSSQQYPTAFCTEVQPKIVLLGISLFAGQEPDPARIPTTRLRSSLSRPWRRGLRHWWAVAPPWRCHTAMRHSCWHSALSFNLATTSLPRSSSTEERTRNSAPPCRVCFAEVHGMLSSTVVLHAAHTSVLLLM